MIDLVEAWRPTQRVLVGDSRLRLKEIPDDSVDSAVTDPPYDLTAGSRNGSPRQNDPATPFGRTRLGGERGFMGQTWDASGVAFDPLFWAEVLRVLKPGAHVAAFGSPRTWHRMVCAIEDAGFEIREQVLAMTFGSGFPKSLDVAKQLRRLDPRAAGAQGAQSMQVARQIQWALDQASPETVLAMEAEFGFPIRAVAAQALTSEVLTSEFVLLGDHWDAICEVLGLAELPSDDRFVAWSVGAFFREAREAAGPVGSWTGTEEELDALIERWQGWGTALKPAWEPIALARKPLGATVVDSVVRWGTGAINVDGCRVDGAGEAEGGGGRWPANLVLVHHPACTVAGERVVGGDPRPGRTGTRDGGFGNVGADKGAGGPCGPFYGSDDGTETVDEWACHPDCPVNALNVANGDRPGCAVPSAARSGSLYRPGQGAYQRQGPIYAGTGPVARFFTQVGWPEPTDDPLSAVDTPLRYIAKPSTAERNMFLADSAGVPVPNDHPTVKSLDLIRWLIRLLTPPGGVVLDPFLGSGTTAEAALNEGFEFVGCELTAAYVPIIEARIRRATMGLSPGTDRFERARRAAASRRRAQEAGQLDLFG